MHVCLAGIFAVVLALSAPPVLAKDLPEGGFTIADIVSWLQDHGYQAKIVEDKDGKHVSSAAGGIPFGVFLFDCNDGTRCGSMQFSAGFATHGKFDTSQMNAWNSTSRWARGYFDKDNDPWIEYDVDLTPGGTYENLDDEFAIWTKQLDRFVKKYNLQ